MSPWPVHLPHTGIWTVFFVFFVFMFYSSLYHRNASRGNPLAGLAVRNQNTLSELAIKVAKHDTSTAAMQDHFKPGFDWFMCVTE